MSKKWISFSLEQLPTCCGFFEAGDFDAGDFAHEESDEWTSRRDVSADTYTEAWKKAIAEMRTEAKNGHHKEGTRPIIFNFVKRKGNFRYDTNVLRKLVKAEPDVKFIGKWVNCNTGNTIESYVLMNGAK